MPAINMVSGHVAVDLQSSPINPAWIRDGHPTARNAILSRSHDRAATTLIWDCTPGRFVWHYDADETIHILEGSVVLDDGVTGPQRLGTGDVVFFPAGAVVDWTVETHLRKLAFFRRPLPKPLAVISRALGKVAGLVSRRRSRATALGAT